MINNLEDMHDHILECYPQEAVGYVSSQVYYPCENIHPEPANNFQLSEQASFSLSKIENHILLHSHCMERFSEHPCTPSYEDMLCQERLGIEFGIVHCDGNAVSDIVMFGSPKTEPLLGRSYLSNIYDCFTLARDYYRQEMGVIIGSHPRPADWQEWDKYYIENTYKSCGFEELPPNAVLKAGDILLYGIASATPNHIGIFTHPFVFIHHLHNRKSCTDSMIKWERQLMKTLRYTGEKTII